LLLFKSITNKEENTHKLLRVLTINNTGAAFVTIESEGLGTDVDDDLFQILFGAVHLRGVPLITHIL
jgi:hypothetical protein